MPLNDIYIDENKNKKELINWVQLLGQKKNENLYKHFMNNILYIIEI